MVWKPHLIIATLALLAGAPGSYAKPVKVPKGKSTTVPSTQTFNFNVSKFTGAPDGYTANILGVNNQLGVPIIVNKGDTISLNVNNNLDEPTSIHFHGMLQNGTNWYDGASMVTQCPIKPGNSLNYEFTVNNQHGTYWWHSHHKSQYIQGLRGPLIIRDPDNEPYTADYDSEIIVQLTDWYHQDKDVLLAQYFAPGGNGDEPLPDSALMNGKGQYACLSHKKRHGHGHGHGKGKVARDATGCVGGSAPMEIFNVTQGQRVRFRIINMSAMATFNFSIDGHKLDVIEADGVDTVKTTVDVVRINVAQRYSVIVNFNQTAQDYWVRATIDVSQWPQNNTSTLNPAVLGILHYGGNNTAPSTPTTHPPSQPVQLNPYTLLPYNYPAPPPSYDLGLSMRFDIRSDPNDNVTKAFVTVDDLYTGIPYQMPTGNPTLFDVMQGNALPNSSLGVDVALNSVVELSIWNDDSTEHVFHLHGHQFWVVASGAALNAPIVHDTTQNYPVRDTIAVPGCHIRSGNTGEGICGGGLGYVRIRFVTNNPGVWLLHCHMEWHMAAGLAMSVIVDAPGLQAAKNTLPAGIAATCKA